MEYVPTVPVETEIAAWFCADLAVGGVETVKRSYKVSADC